MTAKKDDDRFIRTSVCEIAACGVSILNIYAPLSAFCQGPFEKSKLSLMKILAAAALISLSAVAASGNPYVAAKKAELSKVGVKTFTAPNYKPGLVRHIVLFRYGASVTRAQKAEVRRRFLALKKLCVRSGKPYIQSIEAGSQISGEGAGGGFEDGFVVTFRSQGDANYYIGKPLVRDPGFFDPAHEAFKNFVGPLLRQPAIPSGVLVFDMAVGAESGMPAIAQTATNFQGKIALELPAALENRRGAYERLIMESRDEALAWFAEQGMPLGKDNLIDRAIVFQNVEAARQYMTKLGDVSNIPATFGGTVIGRTLYLVSEEGFRPSWTKLYPAWPWNERSYRSLIVHELAHRAHADVSIELTGSEDAMGPSWFFEGLAVACASQFVKGETPMDAGEILDEVGAGKKPKTSYPLYGRIVRGLARLVPMKTLVESAADRDFPDKLLQAKK